MINAETGAVTLCPGCPGQGTFVGELTEATQVDISNRRLPYSDYDEMSLTVGIVFTDADGGVSNKIRTSLDRENLRGTAFAVGLKTGRADKLLGYNRQAAKLDNASKRASKTLIRRVGRCVGAGCDNNCPALDGGVFGKLLQAEL